MKKWNHRGFWAPLLGGVFFAWGTTDLPWTQSVSLGLGIALISYSAASFVLERDRVARSSVATD